MSASSTAVPVHVSNAACPRCGPPTPGGTTCHTCLADQAEFEAAKLRENLTALVNARGSFKALPAERRSELLGGMGFLPESIPPLMDDIALIEAVADPEALEDVLDACSAELVRRLGSPSAAEEGAFASKPPSQMTFVIESVSGRPLPRHKQ